VIRRLEVQHFKAFERYSLYLPGTAFLAGPNNAGKSTLIAALRTAARMLRVASRRRATDSFLDRGRTVLGHTFSSSQFGFVEENLRHEFRDHESRMTVRFTDGLQLTAVWPLEPDEYPSFFYLHEGGNAVSHPDDVAHRTAVSLVGTSAIRSAIWAIAAAG
jgi:predicted ATP-dependent endonuclease of OLD family